MFLYNMIMKYFEDLVWIGWNHCLECSAWIDKHFDNYHVLDYVHSGELSLQLDDNPPFKLKGPCMWWTFPGPRIRFGKKVTDNATWDHRFIAFRGSRIAKYIEGGLISYSASQPFLKINNPNKFASSMDELINYLSTPDHNPARSVHMLEGIMLQLHEQYIQTEAFSPPEKKVEALIAGLSSNPEKEWNFQRESMKIKISYSHMRRIFKNLSGNSPNQYLLNARLEKAAILLRQNEHVIKDIALRCGFPDIYYFSKIFKSRFGILPGKFWAASSR